MNFYAGECDEFIGIHAHTHTLARFDGTGKFVGVLVTCLSNSLDLTARTHCRYVNWECVRTSSSIRRLYGTHANQNILLGLKHSNKMALDGDTR